MSEEPDLLQLFAYGTDREWYDATEHCGGCGDDGCHDGPCVDTRWGYCSRCPDRRAQGVAQ